MLYLFVAAYPYGKQENFLEVELPYLVRKFPQICIVPFGSHNLQIRPLPNGCFVDNSLRNPRIVKIILGLLNIWRVYPLFINDLLANKQDIKFYDLKKWLSTCVMAAYYMQSKIVKRLSNTIRTDDIIYYYWGSGYNAIAPFFKGKARQVSRFHGDGDLWLDGGKSEGYMPCRSKLLDSIDLAISISNKGALFLKQRYNTNNVITSHLGTIDKGIGKKSSDGIIRVLSCSTVYPLKRVDLILESVKELAKIGNSVIWTHIGGGPDFDKLSSLVNSQKTSNLSVNLLGEVPLRDVYEYYKVNAVDVFLNLSTNEGIPVSMMEALSFNIPTVATNVGGNSEVVTEKSGKLVSANPEPHEVANSIIEVINDNKLSPRVFWEDNFNAEKNYSTFADILYNINI